MIARIAPFTVIKGGRRAKPRRQPPSDLARLAADVERRCPQHVDFIACLIVNIMAEEGLSPITGTQRSGQ